jgi:NTE family protein
VTTALVLGGGGVAGAAWEAGLLLGLLDVGLDLGTADRIVGTSAGSRVAAEVANDVPLAESFARHVAPVPEYEIPVTFDVEEMMKVFATAQATASPGPAMSRLIGTYAVSAETVSEEVRRAIIAARLPVHTWPDRDVQITAVDAATGELRVFTPASGVELVDAVAASCAVPGVWPAVTIEGRRYIDGGVRSVSNADLATGCDRVVVLEPVADTPLVAPEVARAVQALESAGRVLRIGPDDASAAVLAGNLLDPGTARPAALAGRAQAAAHVEFLRSVWGAA